MRTLLVGILLVVSSLAAVAADVSTLVKKLGAEDAEVRRDAAKQLSELGKDAAPATKALTKSLKDSDRFVRRFAAQAIGNIGPAAKDAVPALTELLQDDKSPVREAAIRALARMGPSAVPALTKAMQGTSTDVQEKAIAALGEAGPAGMSALVAAIRDVKLDASMRRRAIEAVLPQGKAAASAIPSLVETVKTPKAKGPEARQLRLDAVQALGSLARAGDKDAVTLLEEIAGDEALKDNQLKNVSKQALKKIKARK